MGSSVIRVGVASQGGESIDRHFGRADRFEIYQWNGRRFEFVCERRVTPLCGEDGHGDGLAAAAARFSDCQFVLAVTGGPPVVQALARQGTVFLEADGPVVPTLEAFARSAPYRNTFQPRSSSNG